jgi:expansin (peptidoglycan-binding protein)
MSPIGRPWQLPAAPRAPLTLNLTGVVWVTGTVSIFNGGTIKLDSSLGTKSSVLIADNPANQSTGGSIGIGNNGVLQGSGNSKSYLTLVSTNTGTTDSAPAVHLSNNALNAIFYATQGEILIDNNSNLGAATGYGLHLSNNASITYSAGMASTSVQVGPGGSWSVASWTEY